jgi:hypothetical protein
MSKPSLFPLVIFEDSDVPEIFWIFAIGGVEESHPVRSFLAASA